jgi:signal transduction histidine kinase
VSTIRQRLTFRLLLGSAVLLMLGEGLGYWLAATALTRQFDETLCAKAMSLAMLIEEEEGGELSIDASESFRREFGPHPGAAFFQLWDANSNVVLRSPSLRDASLSPHYGTVSKPDFHDLVLPGNMDGRAAVFKFKPRPSDDAKAPAVVTDAILGVYIERQGLNHTLAILRTVLATCGIVILVLTATLVPLLLRRELAPMNVLAEQAQRITAESLSFRFPVQQFPRELQPITLTLNGLLGRLETAFDRERQFSDDLAHEFRTPLAELRSLVELALTWPDTRSPQTERQILGLAVRMQDILERLLAIARNEQGCLPIQPDKLDLVALILSVKQSLEPRASARGVAIELTLPPALELITDPVLLHSILSNLMENAVEYAPTRTRVRVEAGLRAKRFFLEIANPSEQLRSEDLVHLFDRFWRKDNARASSFHVGLGLSLARACALSLGYTLDASLTSEASLVMALSGPVEKAAPEINQG